MKREKIMVVVATFFIAACAGYSTIGGHDEPGDDPSGDGNGGDPPSCENDDQCPLNQACDNHLCQDTHDGDGSGAGGGDGGAGGCERDRDCPEKQVCEDGRCEPKCHGDHDRDDDDDDRDDHGGSCAKGPTSCNAGKALICHVPHGDPSNRHGICVGNSAVPAHLAHGDNAGCCPR